MLQSISPPISLTLLTFVFTFLVNVSLSPSVHAQSFKPPPTSQPCNAFHEGQGLYIVGGLGQANSATQAFMLDLSVSWTTKAPVFKQLPPNGPKVDSGSCAMTNNGGDLFILTTGVGYVYNVALNKWQTSFPNPNFAKDTWGFSATNPATGIIYFTEAGMSFEGKDVVIALDLNAAQVNTSGVPAIDTDAPQAAVWSVPLKGMLVFSGVFDPLFMNPAKVNTASKGWSILTTKGVTDFFQKWSCAVPAYGGTKVVLFGNDLQKSVVYIFDPVKLTWKKGLTTPAVIDDSACAITGDQFIIWGGEVNGKPTDTTLIYNLKTDKWVTSYVAPPKNTTTTTTTVESQTSQPSRAPTDVPLSNDTQEPSGKSSSSEAKIVTIIVIVTAVLMTIILGSIFVYYRRTRRSNSGDNASSNGSSTTLTDLRSSVTVITKDDNALRSSRLRGPIESGPISVETHAGSLKEQKWYDFEGVARPLPERPHAILEDEELTSVRTAQEGVFEVMAPVQQHPHAVIDSRSATYSFVDGWGKDEKYE